MCSVPSFPFLAMTCFPLQLHSLTQRSGGRAETTGRWEWQKDARNHLFSMPHTVLTALLQIIDQPRPSGPWNARSWRAGTEVFPSVFNGMGLPETFAEVPECTLLNPSQKPNAMFSVCMFSCFQCPDGRGKPGPCSLTGMF